MAEIPNFLFSNAPPHLNCFNLSVMGLTFDPLMRINSCQGIEFGIESNPPTILPDMTAAET
jgi:hypothetical protein